jgi:glycosyltransferase involved in cell wall biosynthesis
LVSPTVNSSPTPLTKSKTGGPTLSVTIVAQDEERTIGRVLEAVQPIADEIVFIDSGSTDRTIEIAKSFGVRFIHQDWLGYAAQKNMAIDMASGDWILSLDADEILTPQLVQEIRDLMKNGPAEGVDGYKIPRVLFIGEKPIKRGGFYPDAQLRLIKKGQGRFKQRIVHEAIAVEGKVGKLKHDMLHYSYRDVEHFAVTMDKYARLSAEHYYRQEFKPWRASAINEAIHPIWTFFYRQIVRGGVLEGTLGWRLNVIYADYVRKKIAYLRQLVRSTGRG